MIIATRTINDAADLIAFLKTATDRDLREVYLERANSDPVTVSLREDTLTDGSTVHNLIFA